MAETVLNFVLGKLGDMLVKEAQFLGEVGEKVKWVETELTRIKCYLTDADLKRRKRDARAENWLNELRDVAYRIEDATDTFYVEIEDNRQGVEGSHQKHRGFLAKLKRFGHKTTKLPALHKLGTELDGIKKVLEGISKSKVDYEIDPLQERGKWETVVMPFRRATYEDVNETEVVGLEADKNNILKLLLDPETHRRAVITIVGSGGLGKTTLAHMVYKRSMIQVSSRYVNGSIKCFRVHDLLRDVAMNQAGKENFVTVFPNPQDINHRDGAIRRASLQLCDSQLMENVGPKIRTLFLFHVYPEESFSNISKFRLLRVLIIEGRVIDNLNGVNRLIHLKYLAIRYCHSIDGTSICFLDRLKNLETFDFRGNDAVINIPTNIWTISTLRHVLISDYLVPEIPSTADLRNLQTLESMPFNNKPIPHLNNVRRLKLCNKSTEWDVDHAVPHLLGGLPSLTSLKIRSWEANLPMEIVYPRALPNYQKLQIIELGGKWSENVTLKANLFPPHLIKLLLSGSKLGEDPMPELGKLNNLKKLVLLSDVYDGKQMICPAGFPVLQSLIAYCLVEVFTVAKGVMPKLKHLSIAYHCKFDMPPELIHLIQHIEEI